MMTPNGMSFSSYGVFFYFSHEDSHEEKQVRFRWNANSRYFIGTIRNRFDYIHIVYLFFNINSFFCDFFILLFMRKFLICVKKCKQYKLKLFLWSSVFFKLVFIVQNFTAITISYMKKIYGYRTIKRIFL
jgi:hypothetical protein